MDLMQRVSYFLKHQALPASLPPFRIKLKNFKNRSFWGLLAALVLSSILILGVYRYIFPFTHQSHHIQSPAITAPPVRMLTQKTSSFGEIMSSLDRPVYSLAFSPKKNLLYVSFLDNRLGVFDVSNLNKPQSILSTRSSYGEVLLSRDENKVFIYNGQKLDIFASDNISESFSPSHTLPINEKAAINDYNPLLISSDGNLLFLGGNTFQIYNISTKDPKSLYISQSSTTNPLTSIALSKDDKTVFLTFLNSSLVILDVTNPAKPVRLSQFLIDGVPTSIDLLQKTNQLILATFQVNELELQHELFVQRIDVKDLKKPKSLSKNFSSVCQEDAARYIFEQWTQCVSSKVKVYNEDNEQIMLYDEKNLQLISFSKQLSNDPIILLPDDIDSPRSVIFWPGSNIVFIGASRLLTVKLGLEVIPNKQLPLQVNILYQNYLGDTFNPQRTVVTADSRIAFIAGVIGEEKKKLKQYFALEIYDISNSKSPKYLHSFNLTGRPITLTLSPDENFLYIGVDKSLQIVNVTNPLAAKIIRTLSFDDNVFACTLSLDGKLAYIAFKGEVGLRSTFLNLAIVNLFSNVTNSFQRDQDYFIMNVTNSLMTSCFSLDDSIQLSKDGKTLFLLEQDLWIFTLPSWQDLLDRVSIPVPKTIELSNDRCTSIRFAPNSSEILFVISATNTPNLQTLKTLNVSSGETLTSIPLAYGSRDFFCSNALLVLPKTNTLAVVAPYNLMFFDISSLSTLPLIGNFKIEFHSSIWNSLISLNGSSTLFLPTNNQGVIFFSLDQQYTLSIPSKSLRLGEHYSEEIKVLSQNPHLTYNPLSSSYKFNTLSLCNYKSSPLLQSPEIRFSQLPSWMYFDKENGILVSEPRTESDIQSYRLCSTISQKITAKDFDAMPQPISSSSSLLTYLISLGYIGTDYFLTTSFDPAQELALDSRFNSVVEKNIREVLSKKYILTGFQINVESSLDIQLNSRPIQIKTPTRNPVNVIIQLDPLSKAKFANKAYPNVLESITNNKTQITLDGSLLYINYALEQLLVNFEEEEDDGSIAYQSSITINDRLNPTIKKQISTQSFKKYSSPLLNPQSSFSLQNQISNVRVYAGQYNLIPIDHQAFKPQHEEELTYQLIMQDGSQVPEWISLRDLNLIVSSPEKSIFRSFELAIIAKNEFKSVTDKFTLRIYPSFSSVFKTLAAYCGTLISLIGLRLYYPRIYNVLCKKRYRHAQEFVLRPGDNVATIGPYPIVFMAEEILESKILFGLLKSFVARELNQSSISNQNLVQHFIDPVSRELDKSKVKETLDRIPLSKEQINKLKHFIDLASPKKTMICRLILNQLITDQLMSDKASYKLFEKLKQLAFDFVQWRPDSTFIINDEKLQQQIVNNDFALNRTGSFNESLQAGLLLDKRSLDFNYKLLKEALWVHVFNLSNIDASVGAVSIQPKRKVEYRSLYGCIWRFLKKDMSSVLSANGKRLGYGLKHKIDNGVLKFYGIVEDEISGITLIIQIANGRGTILKEIWIQGEPRISDDNLLLDKTNDIL